MNNAHKKKGQDVGTKSSKKTERKKQDKVRKKSLKKKKGQKERMKSLQKIGQGESKSWLHNA